MSSAFVFDPAEAAKPLYPYQVEAIEALSAALAANPTQPQLLQLATGSGKTRVANDIVARWLSSRGGPVMWVTKDWRLLRQAARDAARRHLGLQLYRLGGSQRDLANLAEAPVWWSRPWPAIVYTTIKTLLRRLDSGVLKEISLLVWDESHWGETAGAAKILTRCARSNKPVLGLTATARQGTRYQVVYARSFFDLVRDGFLAFPKTWKMLTGVRWSPERSAGEGDFSPRSLKELAESAERNKAIVKKYAEHADEFRRTIVFACNIDHANELASIFSREGFAAAAVHTHNDEWANSKALDGFQQGRIQILVNVEMLTHGIDVKDANTVFLCRPTGSDILFAQMIGRGCRVAPGKTHFNIVEFTDNLDRYGNLLMTSATFFSGSGSTSIQPASRRVSPPATHHAFDPRGVPRWIPDAPSLPESCRGLWYREGQTFGLELELTESTGEAPDPDTERWASVASALLGALRRVLGEERVARQAIPAYAGGGGVKDCSVWNLEWDSSAGWEVTSRILSGEEGFIEVDGACAALEEAAAIAGARVNYQTGTHLHLGWRGDDIATVKNAIRLVGCFEPGLGTLVAPSRLTAFDGFTYNIEEPNQFCRPVSSIIDEQMLSCSDSIGIILQLIADHSKRYSTFNLKPLATQNTVEVRLHSGTLEARKALLWISLWQQILWAAENRDGIPPLTPRQVIRPVEDIIALARTWLPEARQPQQQAFLERLERRRAEVIETWKIHPELRPWLEGAAGWLGPPADPLDGPRDFLRASRERPCRDASNNEKLNQVFSVIEVLASAGIVPEPGFYAGHPNGHAVITARTAEGVVPVIHVWDHSQGLKFWIYHSPPGDALGRTRSNYTEIRTDSANWLERLGQLLAGRFQIQTTSTLDFSV